MGCKHTSLGKGNREQKTGSREKRYRVFKYKEKRPYRFTTHLKTLYIGTAILEGVDPEIREKLKIKFLENIETGGINEIDVMNPYQLEFVILNDGQLPIRDCIQPLSIEFPENTRLISTNIISVNPKERRVDKLERRVKDRDTVIFNFSLLDRDDYFHVKFLLDGYIDPSSLNFNIELDGLPPKIKPVTYLSSPLIKIPFPALDRTGINKSNIAVGFISLLLSICIGLGALCIASYGLGFDSISSILLSAITLVNSLTALSLFVVSVLAFILIDVPAGQVLGFRRRLPSILYRGRSR